METGLAVRVFEIARELSVEPEAIVAKCKAEQIPGITDEQSRVGAGLAATIREWFTEPDPDHWDQFGWQ